MEPALIVAFFELTGILLSLTAPQITPSGEKNTPYPMRGESISCPILIRPYVSHYVGSHRASGPPGRLAKPLQHRFGAVEIGQLLLNILQAGEIGVTHVRPI